MRCRAVLAIASTLVLLAAGCASKPARFYTLSATATPAATPADLSVAVGPVSVPAAVDRPQIVARVGPNQVQLDEFNRWDAPLSSAIARVVADTEKRIVGSQSISIRVRVDLPAPEGEDRIRRRPLRLAMVIPRSEPVRASDR